MSTQLKPLKIWGKGGPNPPKPAILMEELNLPYEIIPLPFTEVKTPSYTAINPNGRLPSIHDPNTNITLWETGAIIEYLTELYDPTHRLSFAPGTPDSFHAKQWLYFQTTGQGPYYGQAVFFKKYHPEHLPSAIARYVQEINRVTAVLEGQLARQEEEHGGGGGGDGPWLVGNKFSYADLAFVPWQRLVPMLLEKEEYDEDRYPRVKQWIGKMTARETFKRILEDDGH
ncbi:hypothetical protein MMC12_005177 [Toensbergia leucococca]|nr:hypothetical protein [Toensbergia leucococca]